MKAQWGLSCDISRSRYLLLDERHSDLILRFSTALPDYVFDEGERQPRSALKRPKTAKVCAQCSICIIAKWRPLIVSVCSSVRQGCG